MGGCLDAQCEEGRGEDEGREDCVVGSGRESGARLRCLSALIEYSTWLEST